MNEFAGTDYLPDGLGALFPEPRRRRPPVQMIVVHDWAPPPGTTIAALYEAYELGRRHGR